jgi:hypothetical protein
MSEGPRFSETANLDETESLLEHEATVMFNPKGGLPTPEFMVKMGDHIYKQVKGYLKNRPDEDLTRDLALEHFRKVYPKFSKSYPTTLRYMVQMKQYSSKAFLQYLRLIKEKPWNSEKEFVTSQIDYLVKLMRATHKHYNTASIAAYYNEMQEFLTKEGKDFAEKQAKAEKIVAANEKQSNLDRRKKLMEFLKSQEGNSIARKLVDLQDSSPGIVDSLKEMEAENRHIDMKIKEALAKMPPAKIEI